MIEGWVYGGGRGSVGSKRRLRVEKCEGRRKSGRKRSGREGRARGRAEIWKREETDDHAPSTSPVADTPSPAGVLAYFRTT